MNMRRGASRMKVTPETLERMRRMRERGHTYAFIAVLCELATSTAWHWLNGRLWNSKYAKE